jgi:hypothetical protein
VFSDDSEIRSYPLLQISVEAISAEIVRELLTLAAFPRD